MRAEHWIGRVRVGFDAIFLIGAGVFIRWAVAEHASLSAQIVRYAANVAIACGCISLTLWLVISTRKALRKEKP